MRTRIIFDSSILCPGYLHHRNLGELNPEILPRFDDGPTVTVICQATTTDDAGETVGQR